jgi:MFS family permease
MVYGIGVGGEYPLASASAAERAEGNPEMRKRRGETVVLTFSQQGWGNLANTLVIVILLAMQGATGAVSTTQASVTWHVQYAIGTFICLVVMIYRWVYLEESKVWSAERKDIDRELVFEGVSQCY